jgi:DNA polymerase III subunit epsilon
VTGPLTDLTFVVVDVETTGWLDDGAEITEIGAVRLCGGQVTGEFSSLVRPSGLIPADVTTLTGITEGMVSGAPQAAAALRAFLAFAGDCVLVAHNAPFDLGFLTAACAACGISWPRYPVLDTALLARMLLSQDAVPDVRLSTLAGHFDTHAVPCHRALADARATAEVFTGLLRQAAASKPAPGQRGRRADRPAPAGQRGLLGILRRRYATAASGRPGSPVRPAEATRG